jgi:hypothetical protein
MQLFLLLAVALVGGYLLAKSKLSKNIDDAANSTARATKDFGGKIRSLFRRKTPPQGEVIDVTAEPENKTNVSG